MVPRKFSPHHRETPTHATNSELVVKIVIVKEWSEAHSLLYMVQAMPRQLYGQLAVTVFNPTAFLYC
jgi:hypothetical protein